MIRRVVLTVSTIALASAALAQTPAPAQPPRPAMTLTRGPGAPATGPQHHYTFEIYALGAKIDVPPGADAFETRANVMKAVQGHILGKAVYVGLFRRPQ